MSEEETRRAVRDGVIDAEQSGIGTLIILVQSIILGGLAYSSWNLLGIGGASWVGTIAGIVAFLLFFVPGVKSFLVFGFSLMWGAFAYFIIAPYTTEEITSGFFFSSSPVPYVIGLVVFAISWGLQKSATD